MSQRGWAAIGKLLVALLVIVIVVSAIFLMLVLRNGVSARATPTRTEEMIATTARHFAVPRAARNIRNPIPLSPAVLAEGRHHFADHCASCHGNDGSGQTEMGTNFYPKVPDMRTARTQILSDGELFYIIRNGVRLTGMPAWGDERDNTDNWKLVHFIRHLPKITPGEIEEMKKMNPVSAHERMERQEDEEFLKGH